MPQPWDYLVLTASNPSQARAYEEQLGLRRQTGALPQARVALVVDDLEGRRIGSGGSTLQCLAVILNRERQRRGIDAADYDALEAILRDLRILIIHAGGDSRRLPAYGPCGKIFVPIPGETYSALGATLFDRLAPALLELRPGASGAGQVVVASGDALLRFDAASVDFAGDGITALGCRGTPEEAARHGVFCVAGDGTLRLFLQKPSREEQARRGAIDRHGRSVIDIGLMNLDAGAAVALLRAFEVSAGPSGELGWKEPVKGAILGWGLDLYREICCAMGSEASLERFVSAARASGSSWEETRLAELFPRLREIPFRVRVVARCGFLHFGMTRQLVTTGLALAVDDRGVLPDVTCLSVNNEVGGGGRIAGSDSWVEGCRLSAPLTLAGSNVVTSADVSQPLALPEGACLDVTPGSNRAGEQVWFTRCYGIGDTFKDSLGRGATFCGKPLAEWLAAAGAAPGDVWDATVSTEERTLWNARVFPAEREPEGYRRWLWLFDPAAAGSEQKRAFLSAERYSASEIALLTDQEGFHLRRRQIRAANIRRSLDRMFGPDSAFSAEDLAFALEHARDRCAWVAEMLALGRSHLEAGAHGSGMESFVFSRIAHSLGSAIPAVARREEATVFSVFTRLKEKLPREMTEWLNSMDLGMEDGTTVGDWSGRLRQAAFRQLNAAILASTASRGRRPRTGLRPDETIWGRAPARIELGGGWTDTPPYSLEYGGDVTNVAVNLNGQPPIHCYCRVIEEPVIRLFSIDTGRHIEIRTLEELLDYRRPEDSFALAKAALAISGFSPEAGDWGHGVSLPEMLTEFGGGLELTTLVGIPKGSGLGTSSILGAVIVAVLRRMMCREFNQREIFHDVLRLEQALTTGGGWQDQVGGGTGGTKLTSIRPGMIPDPRIHYVPSDLLDPRANGGTTLLYYTGLTRLAKNILEQIVGGYLNRNRAIMAALAEEHLVARCVADALGRKDAAAFGHYVNVAWELQKRLCCDVTNETIEALLARVRPYVHGTRISGAGSGGFLLMICKSPADAARARELLEREPLNERARFFDYDINHAGLEVTTC